MVDRFVGDQISVQQYQQTDSVAKLRISRGLFK